MALLLYAFLTSAAFYLLSRALITKWLWSLYPKPLAHFMDCAACTGFWYGLIAAFVIGRHLHMTVFDLDPFHWSTPILVGLCSIVWTPITAGLMQRGLDSLGTIAE